MNNRSLYIFFLIVLGSIHLISCGELSPNNEALEEDKKTIDTAMIDDLRFIIDGIYCTSDHLFYDLDVKNEFSFHVNGYSINKVLMQYLDNSNKESVLSPNLNTLSYLQGNYTVRYIIEVVDTISSDTTVFRTKNYKLSVDYGISRLFVKEENKNGQLHMQWPQVYNNKPYNYKIERLCGGVTDSFYVEEQYYIDQKYIGESVEYNIYALLPGNKYNKIWHYTKEQESILAEDFQVGDRKYAFSFSKCKYGKNFGQYNIYNSKTEELLFSSTDINDTTYYIDNVNFNGSVYLLVEMLPKDFNPQSEIDRSVFQQNFGVRFGDESFKFEFLVQIDSNIVAYTYAKKLYYRNTTNNQILATKNIENYSKLGATPDGKYICMISEDDTKLLNFWTLEGINNAPVYSCPYNEIPPSLTNNLTFLRVKNPIYSSSYYGVYDVKQQQFTHNTPHSANSMPAYLSANGEYAIFPDIKLHLYQFNDNEIVKVWEGEYEHFHRFDAVNKDICYTMSNGQFYTRNVTDFSIKESFSIEIEAIENIDYHTGHLMGYKSGGIIVVYDIKTGDLIKEVPVSGLSDLFFYSNSTKIIGDVIYTSSGLKYYLK